MINRENNPREQTREKLYQTVEQKIQAIIDIKKFIQQNQELPDDEFYQAADSLHKVIAEQFGVDLNQQVKRLRILESEREDIRNKMINIIDADGRDEAIYSPEFEELSKKDDIICEDINRLHNDDNIEFLKTISDFFSSVVVKKEQVEEAKELYKESKDEFITMIEKQLDIPLLSSSIIKIDISGLNINLIIKKEDFEKIVNSKTIFGQHYLGTVINIIKESPSEETLTHEANHNINESFVKRPFLYKNLINFLQIKINRYHRLKGLNVPQQIIEGELNEIQESLKKYQNENFDEFIADIDNLANGNITTFYYNFSRALTQLGIFEKSIEDREIKQLINDNIELMFTKFTELLGKTSSIFYAAERIKKVDEAKAAIILFTHENLDKVSRHLRNDKNFEFYERMHPLLDEGSFYKSFTKKLDDLDHERQILFKLELVEGSKLLLMIENSNNPGYFFSLENIRQLHELLKENNYELTAADYKVINKNIDELLSEPDVIVDHFTKENFSLEQIKETDKYLKGIGQILRIGTLNTFVEKMIAFTYVESCCEWAIIQDDFSDLMALCSNWPFNPEIISKSILDLLSVGLIYSYYEEKTGKKFDPQSIKKTNFWKFLIARGLDQRADKVMKNK